MDANFIPSFILDPKAVMNSSLPLPNWAAVIDCSMIFLASVVLPAK